ncbi:MAG: MmgE/PrpD family protein [Sediminimonas qiaohouensis]|uniref:MmgE/PrpD family protein n=1 Tax=Sediminimonas qiaohouensis TaxID=552061 RepID=A0A7C9L7A9_9RHOB|nr:MmgE/PrpD family protein [Sediminimonas qiaohouensis]MTJ04095.1 MmgE/PrpD family protein [Sediminimonas qiaohouensis]
MTSLTDRLAGFAAQTAPADIPGSARAVLRLSLLDWAAVAIAGREEPVSRITRSMLLAEAGTPRASVIGHGTRLPPRAAALVNGATSHALDYDDTHFAHIGHPSVAVLPAALALAEDRGADWPALESAALIGLETSVRVGLWLGRGHYQHGFHQTGTAGAFGAALAAARLLDLTADQCAMALGLVATRASGLKSQFGTMGKPFNAGLAAANGIEAALLVEGGFVANPDALEAPQGFGPTHAGSAEEGALNDLGRAWLFEGVSHKFHACCHGLHACLEAAKTLGALDPAAIERIEVATHPRWLSVCNQPAPSTGLGAKFSYATVLPMHFLGHDTAQLHSYSDDLCADPAVQAMRARVAVTGDDSVAETASRVRVTLAGGEVREATHDLAAPMPLEDRQARVREKAGALLGPDIAARMWQLAGGAGGVAGFAAALRGAGDAAPS